MKLPRDVSGHDLVRAPTRFGYAVTRQTGSHMRLSSRIQGIEYHVTIPAHDSLRIGTLSQILNEGLPGTLAGTNLSRICSVRISRPSISSKVHVLEFLCCTNVVAEFHLKISREDVVRVAELAYLDLSETELETYRAQIDEILEYIGKLNELDTANVEPMAQVLTDDQTADATLREDVVVPCGIAAEFLKQAPDPEPPFFRVPKVIER